MKSINTIVFATMSTLLFAGAAYTAENLSDILALSAGVVQGLIYIIDLNNYPSVYFNLCNYYHSLIVPL
jgi:hypothetical protein